jgi:hypothetical protein
LRRDRCGHGLPVALDALDDPESLRMLTEDEVAAYQPELAADLRLHGILCPRAWFADPEEPVRPRRQVRLDHDLAGLRLRRLQPQIGAGGHGRPAHVASTPDFATLLLGTPVSPENFADPELDAELDWFVRNCLARNPRAADRSPEDDKRAILAFLRELPSEPEDTPPPTRDAT